METWHYLENQFDTVTRTSRLRTNALLTDHHTKIAQAAAGNPAVFGPMAAQLIPAKNAWTTGYNAWINARASYRSASQAMDNLFTALRMRPSPEGRSKLGQWESRVAAYWESGHPRYDYLFPQGREPFTEGGRDETITQVLNLATRLGTVAAELATEAGGESPSEPAEVLQEQSDALTALQTQVQTFHTTLSAARTLQQQREGTLDLTSSALSPLRLAAVDAMYKNLGLLMAQFYTVATRGQVADYFDLTLIMTPPADDEDETTDPPEGAGGTPPVPPPLTQTPRQSDGPWLETVNCEMLLSNSELSDISRFQ